MTDTKEGVKEITLNLNLDVYISICTNNYTCVSTLTVGRFHVPVQMSGAMEVPQAFHALRSDGGQSGVVAAPAPVHNVLQRAPIHVLHHQAHLSGGWVIW